MVGTPRLRNYIHRPSYVLLLFFLLVVVGHFCILVFWVFILGPDCAGQRVRVCWDRPSRVDYTHRQVKSKHSSARAAAQFGGTHFGCQRKEKNKSSRQFNPVSIETKLKRSMEMVSCFESILSEKKHGLAWWIGLATTRVTRSNVTIVTIALHEVEKNNNKKTADDQMSWLRPPMRGREFFHATVTMAIAENNEPWRKHC